LRFNEGHVSPADYTKRFKDIQAAPFPSMLVIFSKANVEGLAPATGSAPPIQIEVCRYPLTSIRGG
jgi:hypothetical protein